MTQTAENPALIEARRAYLRGWVPIPLKHNSKAPNLPAGHPYFTRKPTAEEYRRFVWENIGFVTGGLSGIVVLDIDGDEGVHWLMEYGGEVITTPTVLTGSGGYHLYFAYDSRVEKTRIRVAPGIDIKSNGGYVVAPPSIHPDTGKPYRWVDGLTPEDVRLAHMPDWLYETIDRAAKAGNGDHAAPLPKCGVVPEGKRNETIASLAGTLYRRGVPQQAAEAMLIAYNRLCCRPPLAEKEVRQVARSIQRYHHKPDDE